MKYLLHLLITYISMLQICFAVENNLTEFKFYGYFKLDMTYASALMAGDNFAKWVVADSEHPTANTNITVKQSRFGFNLNKGSITGKLEVDFYGLGSAENKAGIMLRKAYADIKLEKFNLRAGQDSDLISPLVPATHNYSVAWWAGNIGYRRPMLKIYHNNDTFDWSVALARNIGGDINDDGLDDGSVGVLPEFQGRMALKLHNKVVIGMSGHYGVENTLEKDGEYTSWSGNLDVSMDISPTVLFQGEVFLGSNLATKLGCIGNASTVDGIRSGGGWANLRIKIGSQTTTAFGISLEDPDDNDLLEYARTKNFMGFANFYHELVPGFKVGIEISYWDTEYKVGYESSQNYEGIRGQFVFLYIL
jgi:hypothetical protein